VLHRKYGECALYVKGRGHPATGRGGPRDSG